MKLFSNLLIVFGILWCLIGGYYLFLKHNPNRLNFQEYKQVQVKAVIAKTEEKQSAPQRIVISDLSIDLELVPAKVENNKWETTNLGASYLVSSPIPGITGNSIIYGHNWSNLLGNLIYAVPGQTVEVAYADNSKKRFTIEYTSTILPSQSSILAPSSDKRITLYTCTGFLDSKRFVVVAILDEKISFASISHP